MQYTGTYHELESIYRKSTVGNGVATAVSSVTWLPGLIGGVHNLHKNKQFFKQLQELPDVEMSDDDDEDARRLDEHYEALSNRWKTDDDKPKPEAKLAKSRFGIWRCNACQTEVTRLHTAEDVCPNCGGALDDIRPSRKG
jgi:hypothetical protein